MLRTLLCVCLALGLTSCATWEFGPPKTLTANQSALDSELALLAIQGKINASNGGFTLTRLESLDGNAFVDALPENFWVPGNVNAVPYYRLSPGRYRLHFRADINFQLGPGVITSQHAANSIEVQLAPGHRYLPVLATNESRYQVSVADLGTSFQPECFPYYQIALNARATLYPGKRGDYAEHLRQYSCQW